MEPAVASGGRSEAGTPRRMTGARPSRSSNRPARRTLRIMSSAHEWELTVPDDGDELLAELRRHGVEPGQRVQVAVSNGAGEPADQPPVPRFFSSFDGPTDLAARSSDILEAE